MFRISVLASGSTGNCALIATPHARLLVDAGVSASRIVERLRALDVDPDSLDGVLLTHEHSDHCRGLARLARTWRVPVLCNAMTRALLCEQMPDTTAWRLLPSGGTVSFAGLEIESFQIPHDAVDPLGFVIRAAGSALGILTDVGHVTPLVRTRLAAVDTLFLESNYDPELLTVDRKRPWSTKQRISSRNGHLSNAQAAELAAELASPRLERVVLGHLSQDCNRPDLATAAVRAALDARSRHDVEIHCAPPHGPTDWFPVRRNPAPESPPPHTPSRPPAVPFQQMKLL